MNTRIVEIKVRMKELATNNLPKGDPETWHGEADDLLCELLTLLGHEDIITDYDEVQK